MTALAGYREAHDVAIADRGETAVPSTIEDPAVLERLRPVLHRSR